jgi:hypothetical protein
MWPIRTCVLLGRLWVKETYQQRAVVTAHCGPFRILIDKSLVADRLEIAQGVVSGIALIQEIAPRRFSWLLNHMNSFFVRDQGTPQYWIATNMCVLPVKRVLHVPVHETASDIVHEATHARLHRLGVPHEMRLQDRLEQVCIREELRFARALASAG